jgi:hypothetical protein
MGCAGGPLTGRRRRARFGATWADRLVGRVLAFGAGALISAVSFELAQEGIALGGGAPVMIGLAAGGLTYFGLDALGAAASWEGPVPGRDRMRVVLTGPPPPTIERLQFELGWTHVQISGLSEPLPVQPASARGTDGIPLPPTGLAVGGR